MVEAFFYALKLKGNCNSYMSIYKKIKCISHKCMCLPQKVFKLNF